jgi:transposase
MGNGAAGATIPTHYIIVRPFVRRNTSKIQQNISGRLTSEDRTRDRYKILGYLSTAAKNGLNQMTALRQAILGRPWMPPLPSPT